MESVAIGGTGGIANSADLDSIANAAQCMRRRFFCWPEQDEIVAARFQRLVVDAYAGEKRVISLRGAHHNSPIEGAALADFTKLSTGYCREAKTEAALYCCTPSVLREGT